MERLGLGPDELLQLNPRLIDGRVAGHDINYLALSGALAAMGRPGDPPTPPLNLIGDFGGGSLYLAFGNMAALWERARSGQGQVVDAAIIDGVASMMTMFTGLLSSGHISLDRETNMLAGAAPFYRCYCCADGLDIAIGALEPNFYSVLLATIGAAPDFLPDQMDCTK